MIVGIMYKAVKPNLESVGLARAIPIHYELDKWAYPDKISDSKIRDGLWVGKHKGFISWLRRYVLLTRGYQIRVFECEIGIVLYETSNRIKTDKVKLIKEVYYKGIK